MVARNGDHTYAKTDRIDIDIYRYIYIYRQGTVLARIRSNFIFTLYYTHRTLRIAVPYVRPYLTTVSWGLERGFIVLLYIINVAANTIGGAAL